MSVRFRMCLAVWMATNAMSLCCSATHADTYELESGWIMEITPALKIRPESQPREVLTMPVLPAATDVVTLDAQSLSPRPAAPVATDPGAAYHSIYRSIPFSRAEYNANPSYRHDSTMEILTGNPRHRTILHHSTLPVRQRRRQVGVVPYRYNNPFRGLNYYFYFPYWNSREFYLR